MYLKAFIPSMTHENRCQYWAVIKKISYLPDLVLKKI